MSKQNLQDIVSEPLMTIKECMDKLGFEYDETDEGFENITCCGEPVHCYGFFDTETLTCEKCGKEIQDIFGVLRIGNATCTMLSPNDYEDVGAKHWVISSYGNGTKHE